ncbi:FAD:protein FMN transferase [Aeromicrobium sp. S22]|uniref:FAD:protein FMN transferase n=1 Tax=Aeromicrobium sp. S22 TaxID=2662029 RepID=UPI0013C0CC44|nr:FAD:protein FMN transferase [Aeromicrobium sp. S22]MRK00274.1 FAD:protein FMN transferase [Aeromicrobium sp. S22]
MHAWTFEAIGTAWQIDSRAPLPAGAEADVAHRVECFDRAWSRFRDDSLVADIARRPGRWTLPDEADLLLSFYGELHEATHGAVNPLVGRRLAELGYDAGYSLRAADDPAAVPDWDSISWDPPVLTTRQPILLDVGAAGKGLLVDLVAGVLGTYVDDFTIDASGDIYHHDPDPTRIAMEHPDDPTRAIGVVDVGPGQALCASATNRRAWGDGLHHVLDARTGRPTRDVRATWVVVPRSCMRADGLATAHFFARADLLAQRFPHEFVRMHADGRVEWSENFPGEVFT